MGAIQPITIGDLYNRYLVPPGKKIKLSDYDPNDTAGLEKTPAVKKKFHENLGEIGRLARMLYAEGKRAFLGIAQSMDTGGKDRLIRKVLKRVDPNYMQVTHFKAPTEVDRRYPPIKRILECIPPKGSMGMFHRSHYEDILFPRVEGGASESIWKPLYEQNNDIEKMLSEHGIKIVKFFLYISKDEGGERLRERLNNPEKQHKFNPRDIEARKHWDKYMEAYEDILNNCSTEWAKWFVLPANHQWFKDLAASEIVLKELESLNLKYPEPTFDPSVIEMAKM